MESSVSARNSRTLPSPSIFLYMTGISALTLTYRNMGRAAVAARRTRAARKKTVRSVTLPCRRSSRLAGIQASDSAKKMKRKKKVSPSSGTISASSKLRTKELSLIKHGYKLIAGVDEAGRGPLCGPVVAACCHIPPKLNAKFVEKIADSKTLNEDQREELFKEITSHPKIFWATGMADNKEIDEVNILQATMLSMHRAIKKMKTKPDYVLIDGNRAPYGHAEAIRSDGSVRKADPPMPKHIKMCEPVIKGDAKCLCIAAASIIAKVTRDRIMDKYDKQYPMYNIKKNKGYPTAEHCSAVHKHGASPIHRMTFAPLKHMKKR